MPENKTVTFCNFDEVFYHAEEHFGVSWNDANDLLFSTGILKYEGIGKVFDDQRECAWYRKNEEYHLYPEAKDVPLEVFNKLDDTAKGHIILWHFMEHHKIEHEFYAAGN